MEYKIHIGGLKPGKYNYELPIDAELFRESGGSRILDAQLTAYVTLDKGSGWMNLTCNVKGDVAVECDRCMERLDLPMDFTSSLAVRSAKLGERPESSDDYIIIDPSEVEIDLRQFLYDYVCVNLPLKAVHPDGECDPVVIEKLSRMTAGGAPDTRSPFSGLQDLLDDKESNKE